MPDINTEINGLKPRYNMEGTLRDFLTAHNNMSMRAFAGDAGQRYLSTLFRILKPKVRAVVSEQPAIFILTRMAEIDPDYPRPALDDLRVQINKTTIYKANDGTPLNIGSPRRSQYRARDHLNALLDIRDCLGAMLREVSAEGIILGEKDKEIFLPAIHQVEEGVQKIRIALGIEPK